MRPGSPNTVAMGLEAQVSFRRRNGQQVPVLFDYPELGDGDGYRVGPQGHWSTANQMVFAQAEVLELDNNGNVVLNQDGSNSTLFAAGVITLNLNGNQLRQVNPTQEALRQPGQTPTPTLMSVAPTTGFYLRYEDGEQGGNRLRTYGGDHALEGELDFAPSHVATSTADVFAAARGGGPTAFYYISLQQGQNDRELRALRADLPTAGTPVWMALDNTGDYLARTAAGGGERRVKIYDVRDAGAHRSITLDGQPLIVGGQFTVINREPHLVLMTANSKLAVVACP
jgi:hypothetical protein